MSREPYAYLQWVCSACGAEPIETGSRLVCETCGNVYRIDSQDRAVYDAEASEE